MDRNDIADYGRFAAGVTFRVLGVLVSVVSVIVTSRGLGVEGRGLFFTCTSAAQITAQFLAFGMPSAVVLVVASEPSRARKAIALAIAAALGGGGTALLVTGLLFRLNSTQWASQKVVDLSPFIAAMVATQILLWWCSSLTQALGAVDRIPLVELVYRMISVGWAAMALFLLKFSFAAFLGGMIIVDALCGGMWLLYILSLAPPAVMARWPHRWIQLSLKAYLPLTLYSAMRRGDALMVTSLAGLKATGLYSVAVQVMDVCQIAPVFLGQKAMWAFSSGHGDSPTIRRLRRLLPAGVTGTMIVAGLAAPLWARLFLGKDFLAVGPVIIALSAGGAALAWETVAAQEINAKGFPIQLSVAWLATFCAAMILLSVMISAFGVVGAGIAMSCSYMLLAVLIHRLRARVRDRV